MDTFLEVVGLLIAGAAVFVVLLLMKATGSNSLVVLGGLLLPALPAIICGVLIAAVGAILGQLKAIRRQAEAQSLLLRSLVRANVNEDPSFDRRERF